MSTDWCVAVFVVAVVLTALVGAAGMAGASVYFITHLHEDVLDEYIDKVQPSHTLARSQPTLAALTLAIVLPHCLCRYPCA